MGIKVANNAVTTLAVDLSAQAGAMTVADSSAFPALSVGDWFWATIANEDESVLEDVKVTAVAGNVWSITRGTDGNTAVAWTAGPTTTVSMRASASLLRDILANATGGLPPVQNLDVHMVNAADDIRVGPSNLGGNTIINRIPGGILLHEGAGWRAEFVVRNAPIIVNKAVLRRTITGGTEWTDTTVITKGGATSFTLDVGKNLLDPCQQTLEFFHDAYLLFYVDPATNAAASMNHFERAALGGLSHILSGDRTETENTIPVGAADPSWFGLAHITIGTPVLGALLLKGSWDAATNTPALAAASASNAGHAYIVTAEGTNDPGGAPPSTTTNATGSTLNGDVAWPTASSSAVTLPAGPFTAAKVVILGAKWTDSGTDDNTFGNEKIMCSINGQAEFDVTALFSARGENSPAEGRAAFDASHLIPNASNTIQLRGLPQTSGTRDHIWWTGLGIEYATGRVFKPGDIIFSDGTAWVKVDNNPDTVIYSSVETKTQGVWIDGKPIYRKVINFGALPNATTKNVAHNITGITQVIRCYGVIYSGAGWVEFNSDEASRNLWITPTIVAINSPQNRSSETAYIIIEYTK